jgi:hypothetical protein
MILRQNLIRKHYSGAYNPQNSLFRLNGLFKNINGGWLSEILLTKMSYGEG